MPKKPTHDELPARIKELEKSVATYRRLVESSPDLFFRTDSDGRIVYVSPAVQQMAGCTPEDAVGKTLRDAFADPDDHDRFLAQLQVNGRLANFEALLKRKGGSTWWASTNACLLRNDDGTAEGVEGTARDITESKAAEQTLKESEQHLRDLAERTSDWLWEVDCKGIFTYCSPKVTELLGFDPADLVGKTPFEFMAPDEAKRVSDTFLGLVSDRKPFDAQENTYRHRDGHSVLVETSAVPILDAEGGILGYRGVNRNISRQMQERARTRQLNELNAELLISGNLNDKLKLITESVVRIFGADFARIWLTRTGDLCDSGCIHAGVVDGPHVCENRQMCLHLVASSGRYSHIDGGHRRVPYGCYKIGRIASGEEPKFVINNAPKDDNVHDREWAAELGLKSFAGYRLLSETGEHLGVLALFSKQVISFDEDALLENLAGTTAHVVQVEGAKEALRENEKSLDAIIENIPHMIFVKHAEDLTFARFNKAGEDLLGYPREDLYGKSDYDFFPKDQADFFVQKDRAVLQSGKLFDIPEEAIHTQSLGERILHTKKIPILDDNQEPIFLLGISEDITERRQAEAFQRFQAQIINQIHDSVISTDMDGMITSWNRGSELLFLYSEDEILGKHVSVLYPEYSHSYLREEIIPTLLSRRSHGIETALLRKGGREFTALVSLSVLTNEAGEINGMIGYTVDVTEQKRARRALADSEKRLAGIIDFLPDPTWVIDLDGRVIAWNKAIEKLTGIDKRDIIGQGDYAYSTPFYDESRPVLIDLVLKRNPQWEEDFLSFKETDGLLVGAVSFHPDMGEDGRYFSSTAARLYNAKGELTGAIESTRDITATMQAGQERERLITELQEALAQVQTLSGMLPICASCKKIRDDQGYWNQIELFISEHSDAKFSHGICPECTEKLYPGIDSTP